MQFWVKVLQVLLAILLWFGIMWMGMRLKERENGTCNAQTSKVLLSWIGHR